MKVNPTNLTRLFKLTLTLSCLLSPLLTSASESTPELPAKENFHLFMLAGQSNMAGRGQVAPQDKVTHPRVLMLTQDGEWVPAVDPVHYDKSIAGVGPGRTFALALAEQDENVVIGLIPTACGGSSIKKWAPEGYHEQTKSHPYDDAIARTHRALQDGTLVGILWHQGEADAGSSSSASQYKARLKELIERFRTEFNDPDLPFIIGQLGQFPEKPWSESRKTVDRAQRELAEEMEYVGFVSSDGLSSKSDHVHFNAESQREFGRRYAEVYLEVIGEEATPPQQ